VVDKSLKLLLVLHCVEFGLQFSDGKFTVKEVESSKGLKDSRICLYLKNNFNIDADVLV